MEINVTGPLPEVVTVIDPQDAMFEQKLVMIRNRSTPQLAAKLGMSARANHLNPKAQQPKPKARPKKVKQVRNARNHYNNKHT